jgi:formylglycine-generating enzyme required for sulfatase activity
VTVGRFRQFVGGWTGGWLPAAGAGKHAHLNGGQGLVNRGAGGGHESGWNVADNSNVAPTGSDLLCDANYATWTPMVAGNEALPINCVNWYEAYAFCIWDGGFLPSEAEWEYAAAGGSQQREYPWGSADPGMTNQYAIYRCYYPDGSAHCTGVLNIAPVGTAALGAGRWGQLDLAGNLFQWNLDWYAPYANASADSANLATASSRVIRGGEFSSLASYFLVPDRDPAMPSYRLGSVGIRCARAP